MKSRTLELVEHLLDRGRYLQQLGRSQDALRILSRLSTFRRLPASVAEEIQFRLGQLQLDRCQWGRSRRHLAAALRYNPANARYHYLLAQSLDNDRDRDPARTLEHYRTSLDLDPSQTDCLCACGLLALRLGRRDLGLACLRAAAELAPDDVAVLANVVTGLCLANRSDEARGLLLAARFRHPRDCRYLRLWNDFQFQRARRFQDETGRQNLARDAGEPVLLPFVRREKETSPDPVSISGRILRHDGPSSPSPHYNRAPRLPNQRQSY